MVFGKLVASCSGETPVVWTLVLSVTFRTPLTVFSAPACLAESLTAKPPTAGSLAVTLPLGALTICLALASETEVLNWTIAVTDLFGDCFAAVASLARRRRRGARRPWPP